jgi:hypothetical protein
MRSAGNRQQRGIRAVSALPAWRRYGCLLVELGGARARSRVLRGDCPLRSRTPRAPSHGARTFCSLEDKRRVRSLAVSPQVEKLIGEHSAPQDELIRREHRRVERRQCENAIAAVGRAIGTLTVIAGKHLFDVVAKVDLTKGAAELRGLRRSPDRTYRRCNRSMRQRKHFGHNVRLSFRFASPRR